MIDAKCPRTWPSFSLCAELDFLPDFAGFRLWQRKADGVRAYLSNRHLMLRGGRPIKHGLTLTGDPVPDGWLLDGELLAVGGDATDVMGRVNRKQWDQLHFEAFDVLRVEAHEMIDRPYEQRLSLLVDLLPATNVVQTFVEPRQPIPPIPVGWEGIVGKLPGATWQAGRSGNAVKYKVTGHLDAVIVGFDEGQGSWRGTVGAVRFGLPRADGEIVEVGRAGGLNSADRERFAQDPDRYIGQGCRIKHYGMNKRHLRNPVFESLNEEVS